MKNLRAFGGVFGAAALILAGCGQPAVESQEFVSSVEVPETVRLHFTTFSKSKSGATWMAWPNSVKAALEGFASISEILFDLERDDIVVKYQPSEISVDEILKACADAGFPATVVTVPVEEASEPAASLAADNAPDFYMASLAKAKEENNPVLLDFSAEWCSPCQQMIQEVFPDPRVAELLDRFVFITIDTDEYPALAQKFGVVAMPDMRILNPDGIEIRQLLGFHGVEDLSEELTQVLEELKE